VKTKTRFTEPGQDPSAQPTEAWAGEKVVNTQGVGVAVNGGLEIVVDPSATKVTAKADMVALANDDDDLCDRIARAPGAVREALAQVAGREQMIVRVYAAAAPSSNEPRPAEAPRMPGDADPPSGVAYLVERARVRRAAAELPELAPLRPVFARFVAAERVDRHATPPLLASVYHLLPRGAAADYTAAVEAAAPRLRGVRVTVSGPWAAYAFAPDALAP